MYTTHDRYTIDTVRVRTALLRVCRGGVVDLGRLSVHTHTPRIPRRARRRSEIRMRACRHRHASTAPRKKHFCTTLPGPLLLHKVYSTLYRPGIMRSCRTTDWLNPPISSRATATRRPLCAHATRARAGLRRQRVMGQGRGMQGSVCGGLSRDPSMGHQTWGGLRVGKLAGKGARRRVRRAWAQSTHPCTPHCRHSAVTL